MIVPLEGDTERAAKSRRRIERIKEEKVSEGGQKIKSGREGDGWWLEGGRERTRGL